MNDDDIKSLERVLNLEGDCFVWQYCQNCPLMPYCFNDKISKGKPTEKENRVQMALQKIAYNILIEGEHGESEIPRTIEHNLSK